MAQQATIDWGGVTVQEAQVSTMTVTALDESGQTVQILYDHGAIIVTEGFGTASASRHFLDVNEVSSLLTALRAQAGEARKGVDLGALHVMIATLARLVNSPGPAPF